MLGTNYRLSSSQVRKVQLDQQGRKVNKVTRVLKVPLGLMERVRLVIREIKVSCYIF